LADLLRDRGATRGIQLLGPGAIADLILGPLGRPAGGQRALERALRGVELVREQRRVLGSSAIHGGVPHGSEAVVLAGHRDHGSNVTHVPASLRLAPPACQQRLWRAPDARASARQTPRSRLSPRSNPEPGPGPP